MPTPKITDETLLETVRVWREFGQSPRQAAEVLGISEQTVGDRVRHARKRGLLVDPAIRDSMQAVGTGLVPALTWAKTKSDDGTSYSVLLKPDKEGPEDLVERIKAALSDMPAADPVPPPHATDSDLLTVYPLADAHVGLMAWGAETGEDYNTKIAAERLRTWIARAVDASPASSEAVIIGVGDLLHADDQTNQTPRSKHVLDVDTRHFKTLDMTICALAYAIEYAANRHSKVTVRIISGNHDVNTYLAVMFALAERYRDDPRIEVQKVPGEFWVHVFGRCLFAAHHGDKAKPERMVMFLADEYAEQWGSTLHRVLWTGHLHHHKSADIGGVTWEQLRAITARDAYAVNHAYSARAQLQAITFHRDKGEVMRVKVAE